MRIENRKSIDTKTMLAELRGTPLIFVGERHDEPSHHRLQLDILKAMLADGRALAIGMEMFEYPSQRALDAWSAGKVPEFAIRRVFEANWRNIPWSLYREILLFARDNRIPVVALNAPHDLVLKVSRLGFSSLTAEELRLLPPGVDAEVSEAYLEFMGTAYPTHGREGASFARLCEAQMLRNRVMARRVDGYLRLNPDRVMVVIAGGGHARKAGGIPEELEGKVPYRVVLPPVPGLEPGSVGTGDGDYLLEEPFSWL